MGRRVESTEVVPAELGFGTFGHPVSEPDENLTYLVDGLLDQVLGAHRHGPGVERHIHPVVLEQAIRLEPDEFAPPGCQDRLYTLGDLVDLRSVGRPLFGGHLPEFAPGFGNRARATGELVLDGVQGSKITCGCGLCPGLPQ